MASRQFLQITPGNRSTYSKDERTTGGRLPFQVWRFSDKAISEALAPNHLLFPLQTCVDFVIMDKDNSGEKVTKDHGLEQILVDLNSILEDQISA